MAISSSTANVKFSRAQKLYYIRTVPETEIVNKLNLLLNTLDNTCGVSHKGKPRRMTFISQGPERDFRKIIKEWRDIDITYVSNRNALKMFKMFYTTLPNVVDKFIKVFYKTRSEYDAYYAVNYVIRDFIKLLEKIVNNQRGKKQKQITVALRANYLPQSISNSVVIPTSAPKTFPTFLTADSGVEKMIMVLEQHWTSAMNQKNTVENEFFLEQVASTYLPDSFKLYESFTHAGDDMRNQAFKIFKQQIGLINNQIQTIIDSNVKQSLIELNNQTTFLESKVMKAISPSSPLDLSKSNAVSKPKSKSFKTAFIKRDDTGLGRLDPALLETDFPDPSIRTTY